ncbi:MAG: hypothetical protein WDN04_01935 [Rhodospirillales bacterium]
MRISIDRLNLKDVPKNFHIIPGMPGGSGREGRQPHDLGLHGREICHGAVRGHA